MPKGSHFDNSYQPSYDYSHHNANGYEHCSNYDYIDCFSSECAWDKDRGCVPGKQAFKPDMFPADDYPFMPKGSHFDNSYQPSNDYSHHNANGYGKQAFKPDMIPAAPAPPEATASTDYSDMPSTEYNTHAGMPLTDYYPSDMPSTMPSTDDYPFMPKGSHFDNSYQPSNDYSHHNANGYDNKHHDSQLRDQENNESEEHDDLPECLKDCKFFGMDSEDPTVMCEWWKFEGQLSNKESCLNDCSPGVTYYVNEKIGGMCEPVQEVDPMACVTDCPIHKLDPHSAESFCPWFVQEKRNPCFHDCTDVFLNMAQAHAEFTCSEWNQGENRFTNFINEPMADLLEENNINHLPQCPAGYKNGDYCEVCPAGTYSFVASPLCTPCPDELTSFPGSTSVEECFERKELLPVESYEDSYNHESEDHSMAADRQDS